MACHDVPPLVIVLTQRPDLTSLAEAGKGIEVREVGKGVEIVTTCMISREAEEAIMACVPAKNREEVRKKIALHRRQVAHHMPRPLASEGEIFAVPRLLVEMDGDLEVVDPELLCAEWSPLDFVQDGDAPWSLGSFATTAQSTPFSSICRAKGLSGRLWKLRLCPCCMSRMWKRVCSPSPASWTGFADTKVIIVGQDPYHEEGQAMGLSFSVHEGTEEPPSLRNIHQEIINEGVEQGPWSCDLTRWAEQGVLLLNATLTVRAHQAGSHQRRGWEEFTDAAIRVLAEQKEHLVFILWGSYAQKKGAFIDRNKHLVLTSVHPSPLSAYNGFFGNKHFSRTNEYLVAHGETPINW